VQREKPERDVQKGPIISGVNLNITRNDAGTTLHAAAKRIDVKPQVAAGEITRLGYKELLKKIQPMPTIVVDQIAMNKWLASLPTEKRDRMLKLLKEPRYWQANTRAEVFAKAEIHLKPNGSDGRIIHCYDDEANLEYGCVTNELNDRLREQLSEDYQAGEKHQVIYPGGKSDKEIAQIRARRDGNIIEGDYSNQDATHPIELRKLNACVYKKLGAPEWWLVEYLTQEKVKLFSRQLGLIWQVEGQNHSGECMVTINNVCINAANALGAAATVSQHDRVDILVYGDDGEIFTSADRIVLADCIKKAATQSGMTWKAEFPDRHMATFLQTRVYDSGTEVIPVPKLGRILSRLNIRTKANDAVSDQEYMAGKYLSAAYKLRFLPKIRDTLMQVADSLSDKPYVEKSETYMNAATLRDHIVKTGTLSYDTIAREAIMKIYNLSIEEANDDFTRAGIGTLQYLQNDKRVGYCLSKLQLDKRGFPSQVRGIDSASAKFMCLIDT
jgi:hypothetical protein